MPPIKRPKVGAKTATGSEAKNILARRRNSAAKAVVGSPMSKSPRKTGRKSSEDNGGEDDEPPYEPSGDEIDGDSAEGSPLASPVSKPTKGKKAVEQSPTKLIYKKHLRRDASKFTTSQAMVDAEEEFDPRAAAFRGKATQSSGNGRKKGRRLIRWTAQADQLLLLCLHHEMARNKEELPYEAIAQRMFPEKNATGGAIKERFAKLRIECLNRGSWVPPILGKTPQNTRPDVRGVVRLAPGIDKGRFVLWKEDASKLIDPKDINKGHVDAQKKGLQYPQRVWINPGAEKEYLKSMHDHKALNLSPIAGPVPIDDDEFLSDEGEEDEMKAESDDDVAVPCTPKKRKAPVSTSSSNKKPRAARPTPKKIAPKGKAKQADDSDFDDIAPPSGRRRLSPRNVSVTGKSPGGRQNYVVTPKIEYSDSSTSKAAESSDESDDDESPTNNRLMMMAFDKDEEVKPLRSIVIVRGFTPGALSKYPAGIQGPGDDDYADDEVAENLAVPCDGGKSIADADDEAVVPDQDSLDIQNANGLDGIRQKRSMYTQYYNVQDLLGAMHQNTDGDGQVINKKLFENHLEQMNALNAGGIVESPPQSPTHKPSHQQTQNPQYGEIQSQDQFTANGLSPFSNEFEGPQMDYGGSQIGFGGSQIDFGDFNFLPVRPREIQGMTLERNTKTFNDKSFNDRNFNDKSFNENNLINTAQHQTTRRKRPSSRFDAKPNPGLAGFSGQDVTLAPAPGADFFSFDNYDGGGASLDGSFGPLGPSEGYLKY